MKTCIELAGLLQIVLALMHGLLPRRFHWREELARLSLLNRQIFVVHCLFIVLTLILFGTVSCFFADELLRPSPLARVFLGGLALFWGFRLFVQFFVYSPALWRGNRFNTIAHVIFSLLWLFLLATYGLALWYPK